MEIKFKIDRRQVIFLVFSQNKRWTLECYSPKGGGHFGGSFHQVSSRSVRYKSKNYSFQPVQNSLPTNHHDHKVIHVYVIIEKTS